MINTITTSVVAEPPPPTSSNLLLHCGGFKATRKQVFQVPTPRPTSTWFPLAHRDLVTEVRGQLEAGGFEIRGETHALSHEGARYFGLIEVASRKLKTDSPSDYAWIVGLRNSHDKCYPAGLVAGTRVTVCDNLAFSGEVRISRKHTRHAVRDLRHLVARSVGQLGSMFIRLDQRIEQYRQYAIQDGEAHDIVIKAVDCRAITATQIPEVLQHWRKPLHDEFEPRTGWSLFNAFTETLKQSNPHVAVARGEALHGLFDSRVGLALPS